MIEFKKVIAIDLGQNKGWSYFGILANGEKIQLRKKATRLYENAFQSESNSGVGQGLAGYFSYGKKPSSWALPVKTYVIKNGE